MNDWELDTFVLNPIGVPLSTNDTTTTDTTTDVLNTTEPSIKYYNKTDGSVSMHVGFKITGKKPSLVLKSKVPYCVYMGCVLYNHKGDCLRKYNTSYNNIKYNDIHLSNAILYMKDYTNCDLYIYVSEYIDMDMLQTHILKKEIDKFKSVQLVNISNHHNKGTVEAINSHKNRKVTKHRTIW